MTEPTAAEIIALHGQLADNGLSCRLTRAETEAIFASHKALVDVLKMLRCNSGLRPMDITMIDKALKTAGEK